MAKEKRSYIQYLIEMKSVRLPSGARIKPMSLKHWLERIAGGK